MISAGAWQPWKLWTSGALGVLLLADIALAIFLWMGVRQDPAQLQAERDRLAVQARLLRADVERGEKIRASMPQAGSQCDAFYHQSFLDAATGYSKIEADLGAIAAQSGVRTSGFSFKRVEIKDRGVTQISINTSVDAEYPAVVRFVNGLENSKNFYLLDGLRLETAPTGGIKLDLDLHTFFRT
ncbi:MAG TPA: GspMb/PilO family protein [Verrucomicrobiae bacterium]|nr:GspMb/PilO family protein [Verrucomicrobiae bacterium]